MHQLTSISPANHTGVVRAFDEAWELDKANCPKYNRWMQWMVIKFMNNYIRITEFTKVNGPFGPEVLCPMLSLVLASSVSGSRPTRSVNRAQLYKDHGACCYTISLMHETSCAVVGIRLCSLHSLQTFCRILVRRLVITPRKVALCIRCILGQYCIPEPIK